MSRKDYAQTVSGTPETKKGEKELSPEEIEETLGNLKTRFEENKKLHEGITWADVKASLEADPEAVWSLAQMESAGHEPDIYHDDKDNFYFGTCSKESPESARNCVYDKETADYVRKNYPNEQFNGSAVEMAEEMGITLMLPDHYKDILQEKGKFDINSMNWLLTQNDTLSTGNALFGDRYDGLVNVRRFYARDHNASGAWRGSLRVKKVSA